MGMNFGGDPSSITVWGQSSGGSLVFALAASPMAKGLFQRGISMSGSPRLNSTTEEASSYWHQQVVQRSRCWNFTTSDLATCLLSLNASEIARSTPPNWHSDGFTMDVFLP